MSSSSTTENHPLAPPARVYLAGPMRGYPSYNFPAFIEAANELQLLGFEVWSPAEHDLANGFDPDHDDCLPLRAYMITDLPQVLSSDAIVLLDGWENSRGATLEYDVATRCSVPAYQYPSLSPVEPSVKEASFYDGSSLRRIVTNEITGGQKETRPARFDLLPWDQLWKVAELYAYGATKYEDHNWARGYNLSLSIAALARHLAKFISGEDIDAENGCHHLTSVVFHALAMMRFQDGIAAGDLPQELDDRFPTITWWEEAA